MPAGSISLEQVAQHIAVLAVACSRSPHRPVWPRRADRPAWVSVRHSGLLSLLSKDCPKHGPHIAEIATLVGNPARANILTALLDGRALTATELAYVAGVTPQTASAHLAKLADSGLLAPEKQGRHRYFRLATPQIARKRCAAPTWLSRG